MNIWLLDHARSAATAGSARTYVVTDADQTLVHALDETARSFYLRHGLRPSPSDDLHLMILVKDVRAAINAAG